MPCSPGVGKTFLTIGQDLFSIQEYVTAQYNYSLHQSIREHEVQPMPMSNFVPAAVMVYTDLESLDGLFIPSDYGSGVEYADGVINSIFPNHPAVGLQIGLWLNGSYGCNQVINGNWNQQLFQLGTYLERTNASAVFLRIGYEFDNPFFGYSNDPQAYILTFRKIVSYLKSVLTKRAIQKTNFVWHSWAAPLANDNLTLYDFYPGSDYVDWVGLSIFRQVFPWKSDWSDGGYVDWGGNMDHVLNVIQFAKNEKKPTMIAESTPFGGINLNTTSTSIMGYNNETNDPWDRWFGKVLDLIEEYDIDMWSYINCDWDAQPMRHHIGFGDTRLSSNQEVMRKWHDEVVNGNRLQKFLMAGSLGADENYCSSSMHQRNSILFQNRTRANVNIGGYALLSCVCCLIAIILLVRKYAPFRIRYRPIEDAHETVPLHASVMSN